MAHIIERVTEGCVLGEGPHWDVNTQSLYFVDIMGIILKYTAATKTVTKASVPSKHVSFIVPVANGNNQFIVSWDKELVIISWDGESDNISIVERLCTIGSTPETTDNEFNDGKCDSSGRLWAGTHVIASEFFKTQPLGGLYTLDSKRQLIRQVDKIRIANGLAFNDQAKKMY
ncbi:SGL domain containing protein [Asbolus verrucosus]|uniref:SGL domain containing protein n=1 Tax=Asbolus verrucosus TaxID=1661398 RepID=A0A482W5I1_ASBVE|nr:SGL domain containing protein [Asbolus verrucosus]